MTKYCEFLGLEENEFMGNLENDMMEAFDREYINIEDISEEDYRAAYD
jgi:hypothetical protein